MRAFMETDQCFNGPSDGIEFPQIQSYFDHRKQLRKKCVAETFEFQRSLYFCEYSDDKTTTYLLVLGFLVAILPHIILLHISPLIHFRWELIYYDEVEVGYCAAALLGHAYLLHKETCRRLNMPDLYILRNIDFQISSENENLFFYFHRTLSKVLKKLLFS